MVMVFAPVFSGTLTADPEVATVPLTVSEAPLNVRVGVKFMEVTLFATEAV